MDIEKIEKFIDAGYTKKEIDELLSPGNPEGIQTPDENGSGSAEPEKPKEQSAADPAYDSTVNNEMIKTLTDTVKGLQETVKALQDQNAKRADSGAGKTSDPIKDTIDSFISSL